MISNKKRIQPSNLFPCSLNDKGKTEGADDVDPRFMVFGRLLLLLVGMKGGGLFFPEIKKSSWAKESPDNPLAVKNTVKSSAIEL